LEIRPRSGSPGRYPLREMSDGGRIAAALMIAAALSGAAGCAAPIPAREGERYPVPGHGSSVEAPGGEGAAWTLASVPGALLTFRGVAGSTAEHASMSLVERCAAAPGQPRLAARQLLIGLDDREFLEDRPCEVGGTTGWLQSLEASDEAVRVHLRTVTRLESGCSLDWILVAPPGAGLDAAFDAWWASWSRDRETSGASP
ncbi:MAG: hypothetical protein ACR2PQ_07350, partial [Myxococcota bacterium]